MIWEGVELRVAVREEMPHIWKTRLPSSSNQCKGLGTSILPAVTGAQALESQVPSPRSMASDDPHLWDLSP